jgi:hypothetical protein
MEPRVYVRALGLLAVIGASHVTAGELVGDYVPAFCTAQNIVNRPPQIATPIYEGDSTIRIHDQVAGGALDIFSATWGIQQLGVPTQSSGAFNLAVSATPGDHIYACQFGGNPASVECSPQVTVQTRPGTLAGPELPYPVLRGAAAVTVSGVHPGAEVWIESNGVELGRRWVGPDTSVSIPVPDTLPAFTPLTVRQKINSVVSGSHGTVIWPLSPNVAVPQVMGPVMQDDVAVWVTGITPGSLVEILNANNGAVVGFARVGEPVAKIPTCPIISPVQARVTRDGQVATSATRSMGYYYGPYGLLSEADYDFGVDPSSGLQMEGREYVPSTTLPSNPVVFLVHGNRPQAYCDIVGKGDSGPSVDDSSVGYDYLAYELVQRRFIVYSLKIPYDTLPDARARLLLATVDEVMSRRADVDANSPLGFFGHSLGGDAVIYARSIADPSLALKAVLAVAPTAHSLGYADFDPATGPRAPLLHVFGTDDYFFDDVPDCTSNEFECSLRQYDASWGSKSQLFVKGAGHNEFNTCWGQVDPNGTLPMEEQQEILSAYAVPLFHGMLNGFSADFAPYFQGSVRPRGMYHFDLSMQHHRPAGTTVIDSFGDPPAELSFPDDNTDPLVNSQGGAVSQQNPPVFATGIQEGTHVDVAAEAGYANSHEPAQRALLLEWDSIGHQYVSQLPTPVAAAATDVLAFRVMAVGGDPANDVDGHTGVPTDVMVELSDGTFTAKVRAGSAGAILYPFVGDSGDYRQVFRTVRLPLVAFKTVAPALNLSSLRTVRIGGRLRSTGRLVIDDLEITR